MFKGKAWFYSFIAGSIVGAASLATFIFPDQVVNAAQQTYGTLDIRQQLDIIGRTSDPGLIVRGRNGAFVEIGDGRADDHKIVFKGNAQDFSIGIDDTTDDLVFSFGSVLGTTNILTMDETQVVTFPQPLASTSIDSASSTTAADSAATNDTFEVVMTTPVDTTGTNTHNALTIDAGLGASTGGTNVIAGIQIDTVATDTDYTSTAINIGSGWDRGIVLNSVTFIQSQVTTVIDDTTPDVSTGNIILVGSNTAGNAISDLDGGVAGQIVILVTTGGANWSTLADSGNFNLSAAWSPDSADDSITLLIQADNDYIEIGRVNN